MTILQTTAAALFALSLAAPAFAADGVPRLNVRPTCHPIDASDKTIRIDTERCLKTENDVREQLVRQWADFPLRTGRSAREPPRLPAWRATST